MCHHNTFLLYCSIENTSIAKWNKVTHASIFVSFITMILMAFGGYATFTGYVQG
jgi:sodium-coupled neutral amino acid transporter 11